MMFACALAVAAVIGMAPAAAHAQGPRHLDLGGDLVVGGEAERYLRALQLAGLAPMQPWTIRPLFAQTAAGFAPPTPHPWSARWSAHSGDSGGTGDSGDTARTRFSFEILRPAARLAYNSTFPFEIVPGPTWAGRGLTADIEGGIAMQFGRLRLQVAPRAFVAQNQEFALAPNGQTGDGAFADARFPGNIDAPQRFGAARYARLDPGNSTVSVDLSYASAGVSTAAQSWGPARDYPLVLSAASGGFPHAYLATTQPVNLVIVRAGARLIAGRPSQTKYASVADSMRRWAGALVLTLVPKGLDGLEFGVIRFMQGLSESGIPEWRNISRLFSGSLSGEGGYNSPSENQLVSGFFRWAVARAGLEVYGEYAREDHPNQDRRFAQNPDDWSTYVLGLQHSRTAGPQRIRVFRLEVVNGEASSANRRERGEDDNDYRLAVPLPLYIHGGVIQGHTNNGLFLGSPEAYGGAAWRIGVDDYDSRGRTSLGLERRLRLDWLPGTPAGTTTIVRPDVIYAFRAERLRFVGTREYSVTIIPMIDLNRDIQPGHDLFNLSVALSIRGLR